MLIKFISIILSIMIFVTPRERVEIIIKGLGYSYHLMDEKLSFKEHIHDKINKAYAKFYPSYNFKFYIIVQEHGKISLRVLQLSIWSPYRTRNSSGDEIAKRDFSVYLFTL